MTAAVGYPRLGPLLGTALDRAFLITLRSWPWVLIITAICVMVGVFSLSERIADLATTPWTFVAAANAARTVNPDYRMTGGTVGRLIVVNIGIALFSAVGVLALVWPSVYIGTKLCMAPAAVVFDDVGAEGGFRQSWGLTTGRFWQTLLFGVTSQLAALLPFFVSIFVIAAIAGLLASVKSLHTSSDYVYNVGAEMITPILLYGLQAGWLAGLYWYQSLKAMRDAELAAA